MKKLVDTLPMSTAAPIPAPSVLPSTPETEGTAAYRPLERRLAGLLASVVQQDEVPVDANFFAELGADSLVMAQFCARVRKQPDLPSVSMKDVYRHPTIAALAGALAPAEPAPAPVQARPADLLAGVLAGVLGREEVPVDANFFEDLGADSLVMAQFCARVRKQPDLPPVSMKDVYRHPTIKSLATSLGGTEPVTAGHPMVADLVASPAAGPGTSADLVPTEHSGRDARRGRHRRTPAEGTPATTAEYVVCGALQTLIFLAYTFLFAVIIERGLLWVWEGEGLLEHYLRGAGFGAVTFVVMCTLPILVKWLLIGR
ncbi:MAG: peptide synthetase, partial [Citricoccus sp.]|nr:peptide synthetase [Citricoccus sp. WCRC_4]